MKMIIQLLCFLSLMCISLVSCCSIEDFNELVSAITCPNFINHLTQNFGPESRLERYRAYISSLTFAQLKDHLAKISPEIVAQQGAMALLLQQAALFEHGALFEYQFDDLDKRNFLSAAFDFAFYEDKIEFFELLSKFFGPRKVIYWAMNTETDRNQKINHILINSESSAPSITSELLSYYSDFNLMERILDLQDSGIEGLLVKVLKQIHYTQTPEYYAIARKLIDEGADIIESATPATADPPLFWAICTRYQPFALNFYYRGRGMFRQDVLVKSYRQAKSLKMYKVAFFICVDLRDGNYQHLAADNRQFDYSTEINMMLHESIQQGQGWAVRFLLDNGVDLNGLYGSNSHVIGLLVTTETKAHRMRMIKLLLEKGAQFPRYEHFAHSMPFLAVLMNSETFATEFVTEYLDLHDNEVIFQTLGVACDIGMSQITKELLDTLRNRGVLNEFINRPFCFGQTLLTSAVSQGNRVLVTHLLQLGADVNAVDNLNLTPVYTALMNNNPDLAALLIQEHGAAPLESFKITPELGTQFHKSCLRKIALVNEIIELADPESYVSSLDHIYYTYYHKKPRRSTIPITFESPIEDIAKKYLIQACPFTNCGVWLRRLHLTKIHDNIAGNWK